MERKSGSSSRSPSLSRRPSLKEKKGSSIAKSKKKSSSGGKKERWLLTRKTWRYMTDAVGNLLPEHHRSGSSRRGSTLPTAATAGEACVSSGPTGVTTATTAAAAAVAVAGIPSPPASASPSRASMSPSNSSSTAQTNYPLPFPMYQAPTPPAPPPPPKITPEDIPMLEKHFEQVCTKESKFLLWTRTRPKGLSGPALRDLKIKQKAEAEAGASGGVSPPTAGSSAPSSAPILGKSSSAFSQLFSSHPFHYPHSSQHRRSDASGKEHTISSSEYFSPEEENIDDDDYDEYDNDEEQVTVRERRKSSAASSTMSIIGGAALSFFRPLSTMSTVSTSTASDSSYAMVISGTGVQKIYRNTGIQTDPFPEELLMRLRLQSVQEEQKLQQQMQQHQPGQQFYDDYSIPNQPGSSSFHQSQQHRVLRQHAGMTLFERGYLDEIRETENGNGQSGSNNGSSLSIRMPSPIGGATTALAHTHYQSSQSPSNLPPSTKGSVCPSEKESCDSGRESQEKLLDSQSCTSSGTSGLSPSSGATKSGDGETESSVGKGGSGADTASSTTTDQTDKKSEESGYSSSISDTVMRYLRMVRKNSKADNKDTIDKFKTVNYDRSLRYIKSKNVSVEEALEHEKNKALQAQGKGSETPTSPVGGEVGKLASAPTTTETTTTGKKTKKSSSAQSSSSPEKSVPCTSPSSLSYAVMSSSSSVSGPLSSSGATTSSLSSITTSLPATSTQATSAQPPTTTQQPVVLPSVGIQAGESLIRFLRHFHPGRKLSDFSSTTSYCSSESPTVETTSPRYSIATTAMSSNSEDFYGQNQMIMSGAGSSSGAMSTGAVAGDSRATSTSAVTARSSIDMYSGADSGEFDDVFNNYQQQAVALPRQHASSALLQQQELMTSAAQSSAFSSFSSSAGTSTTSATFNKKSSTSTTYSFSHMFSSQQNVAAGGKAVAGGGLAATSATSIASSMAGSGSSTSVKISSSSPNTPTVAPSTGNLMRSFFSSTPFSSSGGKSSRLKKPLSTTSLISSSTGAAGSLSRPSAAPPTTSSSPNLLSLIHSSASSSLSSFMGRSSRDNSGQRAGGGGGREVPTAAYSYSGTTTCSSGSIPTAHSSSAKPQPPPPSAGKGQTVSFKGSLSTQKGQMTLPISIGGQTRSTSTSLSYAGPGSSSGGGGSGGGTGSGGGGSSYSFLGLSRPDTSALTAFSSAVMQKSKSSSSVLPQYGSGGGDKETQGAHATATSSGASRLMSSKSRIFKSRSKSSTRASSSGSASCTWTPQGKCKWKSVGGRQITLESTNVLSLNESERLTLQEVALDKLRALNLGVEVKIPKEKIGGNLQKPKRRPYLLKKKALSTGFFESGSKSDGKEAGASGLVFGISLSQCVTNDRLRRNRITATSPTQEEWEQTHKRSQNGSRNSVSSTCETTKEEKTGSSESLFWGKRGSLAALDNLSCSSGDIRGEHQPSVPVTVPSIVLACIKHLENFGLHTTGIFRVSTSLKRIRQLREEIDAGKDVNFGEEHSPHDVAALLKEFLRDLPEPLLCRDLYQPFLKTQKIRNRKLQLEAVQYLIQLLPVPNRDTLATLLRFFAKVVDNATETRTKTGDILPGNKMEGYSLATLIAPNILPCMPTEGNVPSMENATLTKERRESIDVVNYLISNYKELFEVPSELLHDVYLHMMDTHPEVIEGILKQKSGFNDDGLDELETTSSVFEGSECGELADIEEATAASTRIFRRREDLLHEGGGKGGQSDAKGDRTRDRSRAKREGSKERSSALSDVEKQQSGGESDSSSTKSTSRWFRRGRGDNKTRTSSDSGSEKVKNKKRDSSLHESKRATSLDSVSLKESASKASTSKSSGDPVADRQRSCSDQSLKVPENLNRRQSSPVLEGSGVITASLKIPVPVPLNIDDTDIPYIEEDNNEPHHLAHHHHSHHHHAGHSQQGSAASPSGKHRCRSASTDSSAFIRNSPSSSHTTTPISSPLRQPSSEVSSPIFSPPASPPYDPATFPYEEMTARIFLGSASPATRQRNQQCPGPNSSALQTTVTTTTTTSSVSFKDPKKDSQASSSSSSASTPTLRPKLEKSSPGSSSTSSASSAAMTHTGPSPSVVTSFHIPQTSFMSTSGGVQPSTSTSSSTPTTSSTPSTPYIASGGEAKGLGKETKGANIAGLIKSKTADFEKLAKSSASSATTSTAAISSIAPKMRLRSQENIMLKQQFLLRQQQADKSRSHGKAMDKDLSSGAGDAPSSQSSGHTPGRSLTRRRHGLAGSASAAAIVSSSAESAGGSAASSQSPGGSHAQSQPISVAGKPPGSSPVPSASTPPPGSSPSRWKRSEIISSRHQSQSNLDPETFV